MQKKGISLIVLVITIIVMIILAAAVVITLSNTGIINRASTATQITNDKQVQTLASVAWADAYAENFRGIELKAEIVNRLTDQGVNVNDYTLNVTDKGIDVIPDSSKVTTLAATEWKFNEHIIGYEFLEVFDYENQTGWEEFPEGCTMTADGFTIDVWGFTIGQSMGVEVFGPVHSSSDEYVFWYVSPNEAGIEAGWYKASNEIEMKALTGQLTGIEEVLQGMKKIEPPTVKFANDTNSTLIKQEIIDLFYGNSNKLNNN